MRAKLSRVLRQHVGIVVNLAKGSVINYRVVWVDNLTVVPVLWLAERGTAAP